MIRQSLVCTALQLFFYSYFFFLKLRAPAPLWSHPPPLPFSIAARLRGFENLRWTAAAVIEANFTQHRPLPPPPASAVIAYAPCWCLSSTELIFTTTPWHISPANQGCMWRHHVILQQAPRTGCVKEPKSIESVVIMTGLRSKTNKNSLTKKECL